MLDNAAENPDEFEFNLLEDLKSRDLLYGDYWEENDDGKVNIDLTDFERLETYTTGMDKLGQFKKLQKFLLPGQTTPTETTSSIEDTGEIPEDDPDDPLKDVVIPIPEFQNFKGMSVKLSTVLRKNDADKVHSPVLIEAIDSLNTAVTETTRYMQKQYKDEDPFGTAKGWALGWTNFRGKAMDRVAEIKINRGKILKRWGWKEYDHRVYMSEKMELDLIPLYIKTVLTAPIKFFAYRKRKASLILYVEGKVSCKFSYSVENPAEEKLLTLLFEELKSFAARYSDAEKRNIELLFSLLIQKEYFDSKGPEGEYVKGRMADMTKKYKSYDELNTLNKELNKLEWTHSLILSEIREKESDIEANESKIQDMKNILEESIIKHHIINSKAEKASADGKTAAALKTDINNQNKTIKKAEKELKTLRDELKALLKKDSDNDEKLQNMLKKNDALVTGDLAASYEALTREGEPLREFLVSEMELGTIFDDKLVAPDNPEETGMDIASASLDRERDRILKLLDDQATQTVKEEEGEAPAAASAS